MYRLHHYQLQVDEWPNVSLANRHNTTVSFKTFFNLETHVNKVILVVRMYRYYYVRFSRWTGSLVEVAGTTEQKERGEMREEGRCQPVSSRLFHPWSHPSSWNLKFAQLNCKRYSDAILGKTLYFQSTSLHWRFSLNFSRLLRSLSHSGRETSSLSPSD